MTQPSTLGRKPGNDMKKNAGLPKMGNAPAANQRDKGLGFNGQDNGSSQRATSSRVQVNQHTGHLNDGRDVQFAQMTNRKGNVGKLTSNTMGTAPETAAGKGVTGKRDWMPKAGQNYNGNPDKIQMKQFANRRGNDGC